MEITMQSWISEEEIEDFLSMLQVDTETDCYLWQGAKSPNGYGVVSIGGKPISTHRLAWLLTMDDDPEGFYCCHTCDRKDCCNTAHMFLGTAKQNSEDAVKKGRYKTGFRPTPRRISSKQLEIMIARHHAGESWYRIGKDTCFPQQVVKRKVERAIKARSGGQVAA
jgi:hypothetical protein